MGQHQKHTVFLNNDERNLLEQNVKSGSWTAREVNRAQVLLLADMNGPHALQDEEVAERVGISKSAVAYRRKRFSETKSIEDTIFDKARSGRPTIVDAAVEANITMIACSEAPEGQARWTLRMIKDRLVELEVVDDIGESTVRRSLKKTKLGPG